MHPLIDVSHKNVLIIGYPASGKTYVSNALAKDNPGHTLIHTDDYIKYGFEEALYVLLDELKEVKRPTIIEGIGGYRLLRKGVELDCYYPDIVVELQVPDAVARMEYARNRPGKNYASLKGFNKAQDKILNDYKVMAKALPKSKRPKWIQLKNSY